MKYSNIFRIERHSVKDEFIGDFAAKKNEIDWYIKVSLHHSWLKTSHKVKKINTSDYEETLIKFLENPDSVTNKHPLFIIIGGAGSGKSSTIRYAMQKADVCKGCSNYGSCDKNFPSRILIDYLPFKAEVATRNEYSLTNLDKQERENQFWLHAIEVLNKVVDNYISIEKEVSEFWTWLITGCKARYSFFFYQLLYPKAHLFSNPTVNSDALEKLRNHLYEKLDAQKIAYYNLCKIAFLRQNSNYNCNVLVFDNIDTLDPFLQEKLIEFAIEAYRLFGCKSIIPVRPYTFYLNIDAADFTEVIEHCLPSAKDVIDKRLEYYNQNGNSEVANSLNKVMKLIFEGDKLLRDVFEASAGESIRFGLRNLYNFLLSPLLITHIDGKSVEEIDMNANIFFQAFFCSETKDEQLYEGNFVNILTSGRSKNAPYLSTIKLRTLFFVYQRKETTLKKLVDFLIGFGYQDEDILNTINEFLEKRKALIWSSKYAHYDSNTLQEGENNLIVITPMGENYFEGLINQTGYLRECIVAFENHREIYMDASLKKTIAIIKELFDEDLNEIEIFCTSNSVEEYRLLYDNADPSIIIILWNKVFASLQKIINNFAKVDFDVRYGDYMKSKVNKLLGEFSSKG